jgi:outer membrane protein assembly factor BamB
MKVGKWVNLLPVSILLIGGLSLGSLLLGPDPGAGLSLRVPIASNEPNLIEASGEFEGVLQVLDDAPLPDRPAPWGAWPRFRGPNMDAIGSTEQALNLEWSQQPPAERWAVDLGEGYAGAATRDGRVFVTDYDQVALGDAIRCFALEDGRELWRYGYPVKIKRNHGMSRTIPTVDADTLISLGPKCHLVCLDPATGALRWMRDLPREDGVKVPAWYAGQCPLVDDGRLILGLGGKDALLMALDVNDGTPLWTTPNPRGWAMTHSSVVPMQWGEQKGYVYCASKGVVGVSAQDGRILWEYPDWRINIANVPTPVVIDAERVFLSGGYNAGSMMLKITARDGELAAEEAYRLGPKVFGSEQQTPVLFRDHLYGVRPDKQLVCLDLAGTVRWTSGAAHKFGLGPYMIINEHIFVMDDHGHLSVVPADPEAFSLVAETQVLQGHESWAPMALASGRLIVRDLTRMVCLDLLP